MKVTGEATLHEPLEIAVCASAAHAVRRSKRAASKSGTADGFRENYSVNRQAEPLGGYLLGKRSSRPRNGGPSDRRESINATRRTVGQTRDANDHGSDYGLVAAVQ